jgi:hypothetical protein
MVAKNPPSSSASPLSFAGLPVDEEDEPELGTVAAYSTVIEAEMARGRLEAAGIPSRVVDGNTVGMVQVLSHAVGGVKLKVPLTDLEEARAVLVSPAAILDDDGGDDDGDGADDEAPDAQSAPSSKDQLALRAFRASMIGFVVAPPVLHLWSLSLLVGYATAGGVASSQARRRARTALVVDVVVLGLVGFALTRL